MAYEDRNGRTLKIGDRCMYDGLEWEIYAFRFYNQKVRLTRGGTSATKMKKVYIDVHSAKIRQSWS